jgi:hypothetical protein
MQSIDESLFPEYHDVIPARLHVAGRVVLRVHAELEVVRVAAAAGHPQPLDAVDEHGEPRRVHVVDHVQLEPAVVDVALDHPLAVVPQLAVVDVQHQRGGGLAAAEHLHDGHPRRAGGHVAVALELPHSGRVVVTLETKFNCQLISKSQLSMYISNDNRRSVLSIKQGIGVRSSAAKSVC